MPSDTNKQIMLSVRGENPLSPADPPYNNFVAVARLGTDIQFEFIFLDLNQLALYTEQVKKGEAAPEADFQGKTVAKIVMPGQSFIHVRQHLDQIFKALEDALQSQEATSIAGGQS